LEEYGGLRAACASGARPRVTAQGRARVRVVPLGQVARTPRKREACAACGEPKARREAGFNGCCQRCSTRGTAQDGVEDGEDERDPAGEELLLLARWSEEMWDELVADKQRHGGAAGNGEAGHGRRAGCGCCSCL